MNIFMGKFVSCKNKILLTYCIDLINSFERKANGMMLIKAITTTSVHIPFQHQKIKKKTDERNQNQNMPDLN